VGFNAVANDTGLSSFV